MTESVVTFATPTRIHIGVGVTDVEASVEFYATLFDQDPTKLRDDYAKFEVVDPPINFSMSRSSVPAPRDQGTQHFGIQVKSTDAVAAMKTRLEARGLQTLVEENVTCCYARQDKVWAVDPDGHRWEVFVVLDADSPVHTIPTEQPKAGDEPCCAPTCCK